jgi:pimeloyl-ACP methyl ester carboxylesterase
MTTVTAVRPLTPAPQPPLWRLLAERSGAPVPRGLLTGRTATVTLHPDDAGPLSLVLGHGRLRLSTRRDTRPTTTIRASSERLRDVLAGTESGVAAFLAGTLQVRGDLSLALALDGLFEDGTTRPYRWPRPALARPDGIPTGYLAAGPPDAPPVVLLHGLGATNASMLPLLWDLATDFRVLAPDLPGFGASAAPRGRYDAAWYVRWLSAFLDETGVRRPVVVGNSMGGRIAVELGLRSPRRPRALVLLAPSPAFRRLRQWIPLVRLLRPELAALPAMVPRAVVVEGLRAMFSEPDRLPGHWYDAAADEFRRVLAHRAGRVAFLACLRQIYLDEAYGQRGFWDRLPALQPPALFVWGDRDRLVPASFARHVERALPDSAAIVLEDCGHVPQLEHPADTADLVRGFLAGLR